jgi:hypothetical protein
MMKPVWKLGTQPSSRRRAGLGSPHRSKAYGFEAFRARRLPVSNR